MRTSRILETPFIVWLVTVLLSLSAAACTSVSDGTTTLELTTAMDEPSREEPPPTQQSKTQNPLPSKDSEGVEKKSALRHTRLTKSGQLIRLEPHSNRVKVETSVERVAPAKTPEPLLPTHTPVPGGIALLTVGPATSPAPKVTFDQAPVYVARRDNAWVAAVGIPLKAKPGEHALTITRPGQPAEQLLFDVVDTEYKTQSLTIANKRKVNPNPDDQARIERDWVQIQKAKTTFNTSALPDLALKWPLKGRISSEFGLRRIYNGQPRNPHSGLDIAAPTGTPIIAPSSGIVIETGDFFFNGQTAFVDHGHGLVTMYCHMSKIIAKKGDTLETGDAIGLVGETGRVTGPHLHLGVLLNGQMVNPTLLLRD